MHVKKEEKIFEKQGRMDNTTDMEWVLDNWDSEGCDLWEEVRSDDFYFNRYNHFKLLCFVNFHMLNSEEFLELALFIL